MFSPILEEVAAELGAKAKIVKVNVDEEPSLAQQFGVMSIPTLAVIKDGKVVSTSVGLRSKRMWCGWQRKLLPCKITTYHI